MYLKAVELDRGFSNAEIRLSEVNNKISQEKKM